MSSDFGGKPFSFIHFLSLASAITELLPDKINLYYEYEPTGYWWDRAREMVTPVAAVPSTANHDNMCIVKAKSAFDFGARTPAGANRGSLMRSGLLSPSQRIE